MKSFKLQICFAILITNCIGCSIFAPKKFSDSAFEEKIITQQNDTITFEQVLNADSNEKFIQVYASYCPVSQESFNDVINYQKENPKKTYIFLSVDHSFIDFKHGLKYVKPKGNVYFLPKKGKGELGKFLKLKGVPRFLLVNQENKITIFNKSKVPK